MTAARKALDALDAALKRATPGPLGQWPNCKDEVFGVIGGDRETIAVFEHPDIDDEDDDDNDFGRAVAHANAAAHVIAVNLSAPLAAVVRAAMEEREAIRSQLEGSPFGGPVDPFNGSAAKARRALDAALDAFNAAALAQGFA